MSLSFSLKLSLDEPALKNDFLIRRDDGPDLSFNGEIVGGVSTRWNGKRRQDPWIELKLYQTKAGQFVCERLDLSEAKPELIRRSADVVDSPHAIMAFFGYGDLARELYSIAGLIPVENVK